MKEIKNIMFFPNGNVAVFNDKGEQMSKFQDSWLLNFIYSIERKGGTIGETCTIQMPNGSNVVLIRNEDGEIINWSS